MSVRAIARVWGGRRTLHWVVSGDISAWSLAPVALEQSPAPVDLPFVKKKKNDGTSAAGWAPWEAKQLQPGAGEAAEAASGAAHGI